MCGIFEKFKFEDYNSCSYFGTQIEDINISDINIKLFEVSKENPWIRKTFGYTQYCDNRSVIMQTAEECKDFAFDFIKNHNDNLFSEKSFDYVYSYFIERYKIKPDIKNRNYYSVLYAIDDINKLNLSKKQDTSMYFNQKVKYEIIDDYVHVDRTKQGIYYGTLVDKKIVSIACWNDYTKSFEIIDGKKKDTIEIGIGTHKDYRQKGYGISNIVFLTEHILNIPHIKYIIYCTSENNINAQKTAESAGFIKINNEKIFDWNIYQ